jgi:hypothetical protein
MKVYLLFQKRAADWPGLSGVYFTKTEAQGAAEAAAPKDGTLRWTLDDSLVHHATPEHHGTTLFYILERRVLGTRPPLWAVECVEHYGVGSPEAEWLDGLYATREGAYVRAARLRAERGDALPYLDAEVSECHVKGG